MKYFTIIYFGLGLILTIPAWGAENFAQLVIAFTENTKKLEVMEFNSDTSIRAKKINACGVLKAMI